jgi:hypothetical protein
LLQQNEPALTTTALSDSTSAPIILAPFDGVAPELVFLMQVHNFHFVQCHVIGPLITVPSVKTVQQAD